MQEINAAYQRIVQFIEAYRYDLVESAGPEDLQKWWADRFYTGVWGPPPPKVQTAATIEVNPAILDIAYLFPCGSPIAGAGYPQQPPPCRTPGRI